MKKLIIAAIAMSAALASISPAQAAQGCGPGGHRGYYGHCRPDRGPRFAPPPVAGNYYHRQGWWDGHRYWGHREHWRGGWRYR